MTVEATGWQTTDAVRRLRANVVAAASDAGARSILVTSIDSGDGGSAVVMNLAAALALAGNLVVVVLARPIDAGLESHLQLDGRPGFTDALAGTARIHDTLCSTGFENLMVCGRGTKAGPGEAGDRAPDEPATDLVPVATYSDLLGSDRPMQVMAELTSTADYVLVDAAPVRVDADAYLLAGACDGVLAVATLARTTRGDVEESSDQLRRAGARLLGSVLIDPDEQDKIDPWWTNGARWTKGARRATGNTNGKAHVRPANNGVLTEAVEA